MNYSFFSRTRVLSLTIVVFSFILIAKLFLLQVVHSNSYSDMADRQYATPSSDIYERGTIFFTRKDGQLVSAAVQSSGFKIAINTEKLIDKESAYKKLTEIVDIPYDEFIKKAEKKNDPYEEIANHVPKDDADKIAMLKIPGVSIFKEKWRFYPGSNMASHTLGFVGYKGDELGGRYGLERSYNEELSRNKDNPYLNFFAEVFTNLKDNLFDDDTREGDVVTSIEPQVQNLLEKELMALKAKYSIDKIGGIIMDPMDGSVYALSVKPDFDPNNFSKIEGTNIFTNPLVENVLEFGSVVKPLVMASAIDAGVVTANTTYNDTGSVTVEKKVINNFDKKGRGPNTSMQEVLNQSLNTGMVFVFEKLGKQRMHDYMLSFGLKEKTGIDLPNETSGLVSGLTANLKNARKIEYTNAAFGQGIAMTPFEMVRALASLSNGGKLVTPHIVDKIKYPDGTEKELTYETVDTKISEETSEEITRMLVNVMDKSLKGGVAKLENYSIAVKTGTAQVAKDGGGGYYEDRHTHSFFGYLPAYEPRFIVFLFAINPKGSQYAATTWADPFLNISKFLINYYEIPPDR